MFKMTIPKNIFGKSLKFLDKLSKIRLIEAMKQIGEEGVELLRQSTPKDSGLTSTMWSYDIVFKKDGSCFLKWKNHNIISGVNVAVILQYGHSTKSGSWVEGRDYINPQMEKLRNKLNEIISKEVKKCQL